MATTHFAPDDTGSTKRPDLYSILGILGYINTIFFLLVYLVLIPGAMVVQEMPLEELQALFEEAMASLPDEQAGQMTEMVEILHSSGLLLAVIYFVRTLFRLFGIIGLWRGRRMGFMIYASAQIIGIFLPHIVLPLKYLGIFGPLMALGMCAAYYSQYKRLT